MAQSCLDHLRVEVCRDQRGGVEVPQVMGAP